MESFYVKLPRNLEVPMVASTDFHEDFQLASNHMEKNPENISFVSLFVIQI